MPITRALLFFAAATALAACASDPAETTAGNGGMVCTRETPVGSHFPVTVCRTREQVAQDKAEADRVKAMIQQTTTVKPPTQ
jgi:hypothetical protein